MLLVDYRLRSASVAVCAPDSVSCWHQQGRVPLAWCHRELWPCTHRSVLSLVAREHQRQTENTEKTTVFSTVFSTLFSQQSECGKQLVLHGLNNYWLGHRKGLLGCVCYKNNRVNRFFFFPWALRIFSKCWFLKGPRKTLGVKNEEHAIKTVPFLNVATNQWLGKGETCHLKTNCSYSVKLRSLKQQLSTRE